MMRIREFEKYEKKGLKMKSKILVTIFVLLVIVSLMSIIFTHIYGFTTIDYQFRDAVHSHIENAYFSSDPITMKNELNTAVEGMKHLELTDNMYGAFFPWNKVPNNQMKWQYQHIASIQTRVDEWEKWENSNAGSQQMQDVNTQKLDNVRKFIKDEGWSDDIAHDAYLVNFYSWIIYLGYFFTFLLILSLLILFVLWGTYVDEMG